MQKKYNYRKYIFITFIIVILNIFQFYFSTQIPKFLADNINVGIIRGGVTKVIYPVMDEKTYDLLKNISNSEIFDSSYSYKDGLYRLNKDAKLDELENITEKSMGNIEKDKKLSIIAHSNKELNYNLSVPYIVRSSLKMLLYAIISAIFVVISSLIISYYTALFSKDLREKLFKKIEYFSMKNVSNIGIGSLITRSTNDITNLQNALSMMFKMSLPAPTALVIIIFQAYMIAPSLINIIIYMTLILFVAVMIAVVVLLKKFERIQKLTDSINKVLREILSGKRVIRAFNKEDDMSDKFSNINKDTYYITHSINKVISIISPFGAFMINVSSSVIIYFIAKLLPINNIGLGNTFAFVQYAVLILVYFLLLINILFYIPTAIISFKRINEVLDEKIDIVYDDKLTEIDDIKTLEFKNVDFSYENTNDKILSNVSFKISKDETLGIIGSTGSGKSTVIKLILRFLDNTAGEILVNGLNIKKISLKSLRNKLAYIPQSSKIFSGTILENVAYTDFNPDIDRAKKAIKLAMAEDFSDIDKVLNQAGTNLSGGQKQRINIARSIYKKSSIMLFDDSFSALDNTTDRIIRQNIKELNNMKIIVSQKIATIMDCDKILVLDNGNVVGYGTHDDLVNTCSIYEELVNSQKGGTL